MQVTPSAVMGSLTGVTLFELRTLFELEGVDEPVGAVLEIGAVLELEPALELALGEAPVELLGTGEP